MSHSALFYFYVPTQNCLNNWQNISVDMCVCGFLEELES